MRTDARSAMMRIKAELIDLSSNAFLRCARYVTPVDIADPWDQSPEFPNVVQAVDKTILFSRRNLMYRINELVGATIKTSPR